MIPSRNDLASRAQLAEAMDAPDCCEEQLLRTLGQFDSVNRWVSRYRHIVRRWVFSDMERRPNRDYHLVDLGAGGCDIDAWILREASRRGLGLRITAYDADPRIVQFARDQFGGTPGLDIHHQDVLAEPTDLPVDYVFANHFLHHLADDQIVTLLRGWLPRTRRRMVFSDLHRTQFAYLGFSLFGSLYRNSFTRQDGLVSIQRGFRPPELEALAERAGMSEAASVHRLVPSRIVCCIQGTEDPAPGRANLGIAHEPWSKRAPPGYDRAECRVPRSDT